MRRSSEDLYHQIRLRRPAEKLVGEIEVLERELAAERKRSAQLAGQVIDQQLAFDQYVGKLVDKMTKED